jgi:hypothetical protein
MKTTTCEVWVAVNDNAEYQMGLDADAALDGLGGAIRLVKLMVTVPTPAPVVVEVTVGEEPAGVAVQVV